ncbi:MAG TPA: CDP-glycerol glycerophosphotransferase family protein [Propionibacteriaceae bacterium]|nr:CDP-glycerol glycerophosphotransferase family protein [Propionibacteriaceae bacterium]
MRIVYNSYNGRYADNPRAIYEGLLRRGDDHEHLWLVGDRHRASFPAGVATARIASGEGVAALESADVLVANCHTDLDRWQKRSDTVYLQTWHGTPLKRIHRAALQTWGDEAMDALDREIARWDVLLTPSRAGTQLLRSAFGYSGAVLQTGYPRNDVLLADDREERRARVRDRLGIAENTTAVLYAPTYRDDDVDSPELTLGLDPTALADQLGGSFVLLLRVHYYLGHRAIAANDPRMRDLSGHPDVADLYLAADVLVTDYSSALFDFAVTGKPILFFAYDLEHYRDRLRGFTLDLEAEAPGPVLVDQEQLTAALLDLPNVTRSHAARYSRFRERYCHLDDGHATERVLAALWPN